MHIPWLEQDSMLCNVSGNWHGDQGMFEIKNSDHSFQIIGRIHDPIFSVTAQVPLRALYKCVSVDNRSLPIDGTAQLHAKGDIDGVHMNGHIIAKNISYAHVVLGSLGRISFKKDNHMWSGSLYGQRSSGITAQGKWSFDQQSNSGRASITNQTPLMFTPTGNWQVPTRAATFDCTFDKTAHLDGSFSITAWDGTRLYV